MRCRLQYLAAQNIAAKVAAKHCFYLIQNFYLEKCLVVMMLMNGVKS